MQTKIHNKTLFVAALSVYLGLLIVGAPPQILAQQSKTVVQAKSENTSLCATAGAEVEALFDKAFFVKAVGDFLADVETLSKIGKFASQSFRLNDEIYIDENGRLRAIHGKGATPNRWLETAFRDFEEKLVAEIDKDLRLFSFRQNYSFNGARQDVKVELTPNNLIVQTSFDAISADQARSLANLYNSVFGLGACRENERKVFYENTKASFENNQVFIVTRLPRGSLDSLLKADEKAN